MITASGASFWDASLPGLMLAVLAMALLPWVDRRNAIVRSLALAACVALAWRYMIWRIAWTIPLEGTLADLVAGTIFVTVEALSMVGSTLALIFLTRVRDRSTEADRNVIWMRETGFFPNVDILICTYNEEEAIVERTIVGALSIDYPNYRVWVCDDGRRPWLKDLCTAHGVGYLTRLDNKHAKAGNINAALAHLSALKDKPELISILDADFVPMPAFLTRAVSLMRERDVGVVQTPQHFFNPDPIQANLSLTRVWPDEQRFFFDIVMASKDAWGAAFCCGTSSVLRFDALMSIGGFPTDSVTEDYLVSLRLRQVGFRTVYLNEALSLGLAPEGLAEYCGQRSRWCLGFVQICRGPSGPLTLRSLPLVDRIMLTETFLYWAATHAFRMLGVIVPALFLLCGIQAVNANVIDAISHILPFIVVQSIVFVWLTQGRVLPIMSDLYQMLCATEVLKAVYAGLLRPKEQKFKVTAKGGDRSQRFVQWPMVRIFAVLLLLTVLGIVRAFLWDQSSPLADSMGVALFWSWYNIIVLLLACHVCIEQPQLRRAERFQTSDAVRIVADGKTTSFESIDISSSGIRLRGHSPAGIGAWVSVTLDDLEMRARIARLTGDGFALEFEPGLQNRIRMIAQVYSGRYRSGIVVIEPRDVAIALAQRLFR